MKTVLNQEYCNYRLAYIRAIYKVVPNNYKLVVEMIGKKYAKSFRLSSEDKETLKFIVKKFVNRDDFKVNYKPITFAQYTLRELGYESTPNQNLTVYTKYISYINKLLFI